MVGRKFYRQRPNAEQNHTIIGKIQYYPNFACKTQVMEHQEFHFLEFPHLNSSQERSPYLRFGLSFPLVDFYSGNK